ncbi:MAG: DUF6801 domain-containing protein [Nocardioides sp.]
MIRLLAATLLFTPLVVTPVGAAASAPTGALPDAPPDARPDARGASVLTSYDCRSEFGSGTASVRSTVALPRTVAASERVAPRRMHVALQVPKRIVDELRRNSVDSLEGSSRSVRLTVGTLRVRVRDVTLLRTDLPTQGAMTLRGSGTTDAFRIRRAGEYAVRVPRRLSVNLTAWVEDDAFGDASATRPLTCAAASGTDRRLATLRVTG